MLSKLLKYEIRSTSRLFLLLYPAIIFLSVINKVLTVVFRDVKFLEIPRSLMMFVYVFLIIAMFVITLIIMLQRFYKNLLGEEGYLMFTLPVSAFKLIMSKLIVSVMWFVASIAVSFISVIILLPDYGFVRDIPQFMSQLSTEFQQEMGFPLAILFWELVVLSIASLIYFISVVYLSMAIGQFANKNRLAVSFGAYMGVSFGVQLIMMIGTGIIMSFVMTNNEAFNHFASQPTILWGLLLLGIVVITIFCAGFLFATNKILSKKLNLE